MEVPPQPLPLPTSTLGRWRSRAGRSCEVKEQGKPARTRAVFMAYQTGHEVSKQAIPTEPGTCSRPIGNASHDTGTPLQVCWREMRKMRFCHEKREPLIVSRVVQSCE